MMNGKRMKRTAAVLTACGVLVATNIVAFAGSDWNRASGGVGTTSATAEVGYNGFNAYASVTASDYVDVSFEGVIRYQGGLGTADLSGGFDQRTYGEISRNCPGEVMGVECSFSIGSDDGTWTPNLYAGTN